MKIIELFKKEWILFKKNKKQIAIVILLPLVFSIIYSFMFSLSNIDLSITICDLDKNEYSSELVKSMQSSYKKVELVHGTDINECKELIKESIRSGSTIGILVEEKFTEKIQNYQSPSLVIYYDNSKPSLGYFSRVYINNDVNKLSKIILRDTETTIKDETMEIETGLSNIIQIMTIMNSSLPSSLSSSFNTVYENINDYSKSVQKINKIDLEFLINPIETPLIGIFEGTNSKGFSFSVLYIVLVMFIVLLLSSVNMVYDKKNNFLIRLKTSTTPIIYYIISKIIFFTIINTLLFFPSFLIFLINQAYFSINWLTLLAAIIVVSTITTLIGMIIGLSSRNESSSIMLSIFVGFSYMLLSGLFYPVELLPEPVSYIVYLLPTYFEIMLLNHALIFNTALASLEFIIIPLGIYFLALLATTYYMIRTEN